MHWIVIVSLAVPPLPSLTVTVTGTEPAVVGQVKIVWRSAGLANVPVGALHL